MKILIVEDNHDSRLVLKKTLQGNGHEVMEAINGEEALALARQSVPDLIVSDILMPVMDGYKLCYEVKHDEALRRIPFVFYTATYTDLEDERLAIGLGASRFILKPLEPDKFMAIITEVVGEVEKNSLPVPSEPVDEPLSLFRKLDASLSRKLEEKVRDLELYKRVFEHADEAIAVCNSDGQIVRQNPGQHRLLGYSDTDLWGKTPAAYLEEEGCRAAGASLAATGLARGEALVTGKDGRRFFVEYSVFPIKDERGRSSSYVWMLHDISPRKEAERRQQLFRTLVDYSNDAIFVIDPDSGRFIDVNERACNRLRYGHDELLQKKVGDVDPDFPTGSKWQEHVEELRREGVLLIESRHRRRDGTDFPVEISVVYTEAGGDDFIVAVARDITDRKQAEERLRLARQEWERTFDAIGDVVTLQDNEMRIIRANRAALEMFGLPLDQIIGRHCYELFRGKSEPCDGCPIPSAIHAFLPYSTEVKHPNLGKVFQVMAVPVLEDDGSLQGVAHFARDITDHKKLEEQYRQAQKMEAIGRLSGGIAHDFNNLLTIILGYSEIAMLRLPEDSPIRDDLREVHVAGERATVLTRQLLAFSRKQVLNVGVINLNSVIENLAKMLKRLIGEDVELNLSCEAERPEIYADTGQMEQVVMNLAVNSRDAMPQGGRLLIRTENIVLDETVFDGYEEMTSGPHVLLSVSDTGEGMTTEVRQRIFEPFYTTKEQGKGTGLGLATVYGIVRQHHGGIHVYSEPGQGTTFRIYLPVSDRVAADKTLGEEGLMSLRGTEVVLVADDEEMVLQLLRDALQTMGYKVLEAASGEEALQVFEREGGRVDLLLSDVLMPGISGVKLAETLYEKDPALKVLLMSGYAEEIVRGRDLLRPEFGFIEKPIVPSLLAKRLRQVLDADKKKNGTPS